MTILNSRSLRLLPEPRLPRLLPSPQTSRLRSLLANRLSSPRRSKLPDQQTSRLPRPRPGRLLSSRASNRPRIQPPVPPRRWFLSGATVEANTGQAQRSASQGLRAKNRIRTTHNSVHQGTPSRVRVRLRLRNRASFYLERLRCMTGAEGLGGLIRRRALMALRARSRMTIIRCVFHLLNGPRGGRYEGEQSPRLLPSLSRLLVQHASGQEDKAGSTSLGHYEDTPGLLTALQGLHVPVLISPFKFGYLTSPILLTLFQQYIHWYSAILCYRRLYLDGAVLETNRADATAIRWKACQPHDCRNPVVSIAKT